MAASLVLFVFAPWLAACRGTEPPDYLSHSHGMGEVWAVDGDRFYVSSGGAVVLWLNGAPAEVIYRPPDQQANDLDVGVRGLWGARGELTALSTSEELRMRSGAEFHAVPEVPGQEPVFFVRGDDMWAVTSPDVNDDLHGLSGIYSLQGGEWSLEVEFGEDFVFGAIGGDPDTGLWVVGNWRERLPQEIRITPVLFRRDSAGWETADSTYLGYISMPGCTAPCDDACPDVTWGTCSANVYTIRGMWVDLDGRAHVMHRGQGILVHDGVQSWKEEVPARFSRVDVAPDGTVYATVSGADGVDPAYMWIHDGTGWRGTELWPHFDVCGLSAFDGGAIVTTCNYDSPDPAFVGCSPFRFWPDGTWQALLHFPPR